ncbi:MAG TPA: thioesterase family protein [Kofleriaceae bacterium]|nr:thioesterase family protein [Kofleriaceae bacterium]
MASMFSAAATVIAAGDGRFTWDVPDGWQQGKGAFGGLVLGALARAMEALEPERGRRLRVISGELCAPMATGATTITAAVLRRGRGTTYLEARADQGHGVVARASALLAEARRPSVARVDVAPPALPPWRELPIAPMGGPAPTFSQHYEYRPVGPFPFAGAAEPQTSGWIRGRAPAGAGPLDAAAVIGLLDAWWPCALVVEPVPRGMATVAFTAEVLVDPGTLDPDTPFAYRAHLAGLADGFSVELRHLWQGDRLVGLNQQTFAAL